MRLLGTLWLAETIKLGTRTSARATLVALTGVGLFGPLWLWFLTHAGVEVNGGDLGAAIDVCAANGMRWSMIVRGFYVSQALWLLLASQSVAGELQAHTLREELLRPVPRHLVLLAKWAALSGWCLLSMIAALAAGSVAAVVLLPGDGVATWAQVVQGAFGAWIAEIGFLAFAVAISVVTRSVAGGVVATLLFLMVDRLTATGLWLLGTFLEGMPADLAPTVPGWLMIVMRASPVLPSNAWSAWRELLDGATPLTWQAWVALAVWTALSAVVAERVFARTDVP
ncbi:MAG: ABC transporter permease subunit [Myxococcales bacterium]|nr:ABC transporter permease subunit [Myxococcales bacterium]